IAALDAETRARVGEVFKRATNIGSDAPQGEPALPPDGAHPTEVLLYRGFLALREALSELTKKGDYPGAFREVAAFAPLLARYFLDVFVMTDDIPLRESRLRLMRSISETCSALARLDLLGG